MRVCVVVLGWRGGGRGWECTGSFDATRMSCLASIGCRMDGRTLSFDVEMGLLDDVSPLELKASKLGQS